MKKYRQIATSRRIGEVFGLSTTNMIVFRKRLGFHYFYGASYLDKSNNEVKEFSRLEDINSFVKEEVKNTVHYNFTAFITLSMLLLSFACGYTYTSCTAVIATFFYLTQRGFINNIIEESLNLNGGKQRSRNHAAEHMVANVFEVLGKIPTIEEARMGSMFHIRCGNNLSYRICFEAILSVIILNCTSIIYPMLSGYEIFVMIVAILITELIDRKFVLFRYLGILELRKPTDIELNMAISAIRIVEEEYKESEDSFMNGAFWVILPNEWL